MDTALRERAGHICELCGADQDLDSLEIGPNADGSIDMEVLLCQACSEQVSGAQALTPNRWHCLNDAAWSQTPVVQVVAYRLLNRMSAEAWARDLVDTLYLDDDTLAWAKEGLAEAAGDDAALVHKDTHGAELMAGDTVTLIKDLKVKGAGFTAKRGTAVRNISLVADNAGHIEGRVNDQRIVILTEFVKKS